MLEVVLYTVVATLLHLITLTTFIASLLTAAAIAITASTEAEDIDIIEFDLTSLRTRKRTVRLAPPLPDVHEAQVLTPQIPVQPLPEEQQAVANPVINPQAH
jgi:hypothetical protein